ncbi:protein phosphatase 2C domain-containing protein [Streptomyces bambusae]|uniref:protein phosphatase 2C domain-containing protein n=1 Tax=Streptomyces bambusae TaxID=1550616 RepID=UPI001CFD78CD|nr:protein phosphatase 2C domain-containing protein [Streptomyces bambusae]MCB5164123.1 protein phosphatase 2C domain-containing protein [Streptomyces bambusae]
MIVAGASVQGAAHLACGRDCQDAFRTAVPGGAVVLAVADGVGSRERSALGAHLAVDTACRLLGTGVPGTAAGPDAWSEWIAARGAAVVDGWLDAVRALLAAGRGDSRSGVDEGPRGVSDADAGELAAGLAAAVVRPPWAAFLAVGDCFGVVLTGAGGEPGGASGPAAERCHLVLPPPLPGDPPPAFLSSPGARLRARTFVLWDPDLSGVVLASDGCAAVALDHPAVRGLPPAAGPLPSARFFGGLASSLRASGGDAAPLRELLAGPAADRTGDDLTVVCALRAAGRPGCP